MQYKELKKHYTLVFTTLIFFASLWLEECLNDLFDAGMISDKLNLLYLKNCSENAIWKHRQSEHRKSSDAGVGVGEFNVYCTYGKFGEIQIQ